MDASKLYPTNHATRRAMTEHEKDLAALGVGAEERTALLGRYEQTAGEVGDALASRAAGRHLDRLIASRKPDALELGDVAVQAAKRRDAESAAAGRAKLIELHGVQGAERLLARVRTFIASKPTTAALLAEHGLGDDETLIQEFAEHVRNTGEGITPAA